jgi:hypothetical protein
MSRLADFFGTLIITIPCRNGHVICADKSLNQGQAMIAEEEVKVRQLGKKGAFAVVHLIRASSGDPKVPDFEPMTLVADFFADKNWNYLKRHKEELAETLRHALDRTFQSRYKLAPTENGDAACQVFVWYLNAFNKLEAFRAELFWDASSRTAKALVSEIVEQVRFGPNFLGNCDPFNETRLGKYPELEHLRTDERFQVASERPTETRGMSETEVVEIGRFLIKACSEAQHIVTPDEIVISKESDCCILDYEDGFRWIPNAGN